MIVVLGDEAKADLFDIAAYVARIDPDGAAELIGALLRQCAELAERPRLYPFARGQEARGIRRRPHGRYLIFYCIDGENVQVLHILHGARNYDALLAEA